jgi:hypothetical protein
MININNSNGKIEDKNKNAKKFFLKFSCINEVNNAINASFNSLIHNLMNISEK